MAMEKRPMANPKTTMAARVRTQARNVGSFARWSRARLGFAFSPNLSPLCTPSATAAPRALFHSLRDYNALAGKILDEFLGHAMPVFQVRWIVLSDGDL